MDNTTIAISLDRKTLERVDGLISRKVFPSRSRAIQAAVAEKLARMERGRLAAECAKLDPIFEKALAGEGEVRRITPPAGVRTCGSGPTQGCKHPQAAHLGLARMKEKL